MTHSPVHIHILAAIICVLVGFGCSSASAGGTVSGTASYRERMALPPDAVLEVSLQDVSLADAPAVELGSLRIENPGSPPFEFEIAYDPEAIDERHSYALRATIRAAGKLLFTTDTTHPVLTRGAGNEVELLLRRVGSERRDAGAMPLGSLPASFEGELPCADCQGIFYHLDLFEDRVFFLRTTKIGYAVGAVSDTIGSWVLDRKDDRLILYGGTEAAIFFRVIDADTIRKLDIEGRDIESSLNYNLRRKEGLKPIELRIEMRGMYRYMADAALFEECLSGRRFQVAQEADNVALERAYLEARQQPGEPLLVSLQGRIAERPAMEGNALVLTVVPERFIGVWPGETCGARRSISPLENIYLKLTRLGDHSVPVFEGKREAHIVLHSEEGRVAGTGGCNRFSGTYEIEGSSIGFGVMAMTRKGCLESKDVDLAMMAALEKATSFRKTAHRVEFLDAEGSMVARFEARELQ